MGDAGATALAEAVKATVLTCQEVCVPGHVLLVTTDVALHSGVSSERRQVIVQFVCAASVFFLLSRREAFTSAQIS